MRLTKNLLKAAVAMAICVTFVSCELPLDLDLDFSGYEIFPDGNPTWPDDGGPTTPPPAYVFVAAAANGDTVVAVGTKFVVWTDDSTWSTTPGPYGEFADVVWMDTMFVAVGSYMNVACSKDGITWNLNGQWSAYCLNSAAYSGTQVVVTGNASAPDYSGPWTKASIFVMNDQGSLDSIGPIDSMPLLTKVLWVDSQFVAFGGYESIMHKSQAMITSKDGVTWTRHPFSPQPEHFFTDVIWCGDHYLAAYGGQIFRSDNGTEWTKVAELNGSVNSLYRHESTYLAVGAEGHISISSDGIQWTQVTFPDLTGLYAAIYCGGQYYAFGWEAVFSSPDGMEWTRCTVR